MNYPDSIKQKVEFFFSSLDLSNTFFLPERTEDGIFELQQEKDGKRLKVSGCYPILFCNSSRHALLLNEQDALGFFKFEKIDIKKIRFKNFKVDYESSSLKITTDYFSITFFPTEQWGWGIQYDNELHLLEALEYGGIEIRI